MTIKRLSVLVLCLCLTLPLAAIAQTEPVATEPAPGDVPAMPDAALVDSAPADTPAEPAVDIEPAAEIPVLEAAPSEEPPAPEAPAEMAPVEDSAVAPAEVAPEATPVDVEAAAELEPVEAAPEQPAEVVVEEAAPAAPTPEAVAPVPAKTPRFVVILPERIDNIWFWFYYTDESEHVVQSAVEKALVRAGIDVVDISAASVFESGSIESVLGKDTALEKARQLGADYVILGSATASKASEGVAYGVTVIRATASITAKIVRVSDGKIIDVFDASALEGGQAVMAAGREALKKAGKSIGDQLTASITTKLAP